MTRFSQLSVFSILTGLTLTLSACSSVSYNHDFDPSIDFSGYRTYAWIQASDSSQAQRFLSPLVERRVAAAVDANLAQKGFEKATTGRPDFLVNFYGATQEKLDVTTYYTGWGYYGWYGGTSVDVRQWTEGTLIIDFIDFSEKDLAWRGWAQGAVDRNSNMPPEEITRRVNEVVGKILQRFPPQAGN
jgi:hypothetical protein